jgi:1-acyl-sn-glycerol-3-phosphate acyltransferase
MNLLTWRAIKLIRLLLHLVRGYIKVRWGWRTLTPLQAQEAVMAWAQGALAIFGAQVSVKGSFTQGGPLLLVSNHISWLDILLYLSLTPVRFVSKSEVQSWPIVGRFAGACRTLFIQRASKRDARKVVEMMRESLLRGDRVAVFPEGTTTTGEEVLPFHANLFESAVNANASVQVASILYVSSVSSPSPMGPTRITTPSFTGEDTLVGSIWRILGLKHFEIWVSLSEAHAPSGLDRRALAQRSSAEVNQLHAQLLALTVNQ